MVEYLDGDPDQPIITGRTYHNNNKSPYPLPDNKTKMVIRSDTHKNEKGKIGFNEMSFEDENGEECIYIHAQKDEEYHIKNDSAIRIDRNRTESIGNSNFIEIAKNNFKYIGGDYYLNVGSIETEMKASMPHKELDHSIMNVARKLDITKSDNLGAGGNYVANIAKDYNLTVTGSFLVRTSNGINISSGDDFSLFSAGNKHERVQQKSFESIRGGKFIHTKEIFEVRCGNSQLTLHQDGTIEIKGNLIKMTADKINLN